MEEPPSPHETPAKKKRNPSFRRTLREQGIDVPPITQRQRDPALPPKRKRKYCHPGRHRANKRKKEAAGEAVSPANNDIPEPDNPPAAVTTDSGSATIQSPVTPPASLVAASSPSGEESSPKSTSSAGRPPSPRRVEGNNEGVTDNAQEAWDPVDPLGLFDKLEGSWTGRPKGCSVQT
ncbi:hypothetical protein PENFLA_c030G08891 [Penicillium flavigenum]|uniref:Uncharacterized protein n=1 Tax=Penicillium flavigenum TaxID=254877 RepID=A0A1V6SPP4_9EURO|nr:hypothetical protein PENFLA_c030G08891 [Penicillium flavigenum]